MPSLPAPLANKASEANAEGGSFKPLEPGVYTGRLSKVNATKASTGNPMWEIEFDTIQELDGNSKPGRLWTNLVLVDSSMWKVGQFFEAFGVPGTTNTDDLINYRVRLRVAKRIIAQGARTGQEGNDINGFDALLDGDPGFAQLAKLQAKLTSGSKPVKAAPAKAAKPAAATAGSAEAEKAAPDDPPWDDASSSNSEVEF